jgi:hypothetical protein
MIRMTYHSAWSSPENAQTRYAKEMLNLHKAMIATRVELLPRIFFADEFLLAELFAGNGAELIGAKLRIGAVHRRGQVDIAVRIKSRRRRIKIAFDHE